MTMTPLKFLLMFVCILGPKASEAELCDPDPCQNGSRCVHKDLSYGYYCVCNAGYFGLHCEFAALCDPNPCKNDGRCVVGDIGYDLGYSCKCQPGYSGLQCQWDSPLCSANTTTPCQNYGRCLDIEGRVCVCTSTYYTGHYCEIVNPCESCPSGTSCEVNKFILSGRKCLDDKGTWLA